MPSGDLNSLPRASDLPGCCKQMVILSTPLFWLLRPPRPLCCLLWLCSYLSCFWSTPNTHSQVWLSGYLIHPWSTPITPPPTPLPAIVTSRIPGKCPPCTPFCQLWLRRFSPIPGVRTPRPARCGYVAISPIPGVRPPRPPLCQLWLRGYLVYPWSTHTTPSQVWLFGYLTHPWSTPTTPTSLPAVATWLSRLSLEYAHHAWPGVAMWLSHPSLEYAHHAHLSASCGYVAISPIPGVRPPRPPICLCQLWRCDYLTYPWSTHTTPSQVWLCGYLTHPWSTPTMPTSPPLPAVAISLIPGSCPPRPPFCQLWLRGFSSIPTHTTPSQVWLCGYLTRPWSTPTTPTSLPAVATWLPRPSLEYAHHAHLSASASCGYVTISLIPGVRTQRPARCGYVAISPIPEVRPPCPPLCLCQLWLSHLSPDHAHHAHPSASCGYVASHQSLEYVHHAQPGVPISPVPGVRPPRPPSASCGYVAISLIPGAYPPRPLFYQLWLCHQSLEYVQRT